MPVPIQYRKSSEAAIATYSYTDISEGTGVVKFYGYSTETSGANLYHLSTNPYYSEEVEVSVSTNTTYNFNLSAFNLPKIIKGTAVINGTIDIKSAAGGTDVDGWILFYIYKVSGSVVSTLGSASTPVYNAAAGAETKHILSVPITISKTNFKKGDILRLTAMIYVYNKVGTNTVSLGIDPQNRDGTYIKPSTDGLITKLEFNCPFVIDL